MSFHFGATSEANAIGVEPGIVACARRALSTTQQDFSIFEGLRDRARQAKLVAAGASRTMDSYHLPDAHGIGHALDLVPYVDGRVQWQRPLSIVTAVHMRAASLALAVPLTWGGVWDRLLGDLDPDNLAHEVQLYVQRYQKTHPPILVNGRLVPRYPIDDPPHFQGLRPKGAAPRVVAA